MTVRVGVIGTGVMGADHIRTLHTSVARAVVTAAFDVDRSRAALALAGLPDARVHDAAGALVDDDAVDAVIVASSDDTHEELVLACLAAGKPVLCEKPLAPTVAGAAKVVAAEQALGRRLVSVGFMRRYDPGYGELKAALVSGDLGAALLLHCVHRNTSAPPGWPTSMLVTSSAIHEIDVTRWLLGEEIAAVSAFAPRRSSLVPGDTQDPVLLVFETASGTLVDVEVFVNARYGYDVRCELVAERGTLTLDAPGPVHLRGGGRASRAVPTDWLGGRFADAYRRELQDWVDGGAGGASAWDGLAAAMVAQAAVAAITTGARQPVAVPHRPPFYA